MTIFTTDSITGTSTNTPTTVASAAPESIPNRLIATATASSKKLLAPMSADGTRFFYTNPLRWHGHEHPLLSNDKHERWFTHTCYCCPPQVARTIARLHNWAYSLDDNGLWVNIYGGSRLETTLPDGSPLALTQETHYPWAGEVTLSVDRAPEAATTLHLRIPGTWRPVSAKTHRAPLLRTCPTLKLLLKTAQPVADKDRLG